MAAGHDVTYVTMRQWDRRGCIGPDGVTRRRGGAEDGAVRHAAGGASCRRSCSAQACCGTCPATARIRRDSHRLVPVFLPAGFGRRAPVRRYRLIVDWFEVWTRELLALVPRTAARAPSARRCSGCASRIRQRASVSHGSTPRRLREEGFAAEVEIVRAVHRAARAAVEPAAPEPLVVFAGRHIPEKRVPALVPAIADGAQPSPELRCSDPRRRPRAQPCRWS